MVIEAYLTFKEAFLVILVLIEYLVIPLAYLEFVILAYPYLVTELMTNFTFYPYSLSGPIMAYSLFGYYDHDERLSFLLFDIYFILDYILVFSFHY